MKVLIVSQYFYPEDFKINELTEELVHRGHNVTVLTGKPNYPKGQYYSGYKFLGVQTEDYKGAKVIRVPLIKRNSGGTLWLIMNYLSFIFFGCLYVLFHKMDFDSIFCFETSPITQAFPAIFAKHKSKAKLSMWVQDLWPESVSAASNIKSPTIIGFIDKIVRYIYDRCDVLFVQSEEFASSITAKGNYLDKIVYAPNWAEDIFIDKSLVNVNKYKHLIPEGFIVMFAGNIGEAQDFDSIIKAASLTRNYENIKWVVVGDGRFRSKLIESIKKEGLHENVLLLGRFPVKEMPSFFIHSDVMLMTLKDEYIFSLTLPSKLQAYMAYGKPIATMINGIANEVVSDAKCGLIANAGDYYQLAQNILELSNMNREELLLMGNNAKQYYHVNFAKNKVIDTIERNMRV